MGADRAYSADSAGDWLAHNWDSHNLIASRRSTFHAKCNAISGINAIIDKLTEPPNTRMEPTAPAGALKIGRFLKNAFSTYRCHSRRGGGSCAGRYAAEPRT